MKCLEAQNLIKTYIQGSLPDEQLLPFMNHIHHCRACQEELELYMIINIALKQDMGGRENLDIQRALDEKLRASDQRVRLIQFRRFASRMTQAVMIAAAVLILGTVFFGGKPLDPMRVLFHNSPSPQEATEEETGELPGEMEAGEETEELPGEMEAGKETEELPGEMTAGEETEELPGEMVVSDETELLTKTETAGVEKGQEPKKETGDTKHG